MNVSLRNFAAVVNAAIERNTLFIEPRIVLISIVAAICFPLYYIIWHYIYPQPYESLTLRLFGSALFTPLIFVRYWPRWASRYVPAYWYFATLYGLPFFFAFMLLMNAASTVWLMSALIAVFFMTLIHNLPNLIIQSILGTGMAWLVYSWTDSHAHIRVEYWEYLSIYLFAIVGGGLLSFSAEMVQKERLSAMLAAASNIAHELRTPLLGIKSGASGLRHYLPALLETYRIAKEQGLAVEPIRIAHLNSMHGVLERVESEADYSNVIIDMLLMNARMDANVPETLTDCSIGQCVEIALRRYPFASEREYQLVEWDGGTDFNFYGVELLMVHVLFNLLKNALYHVARAGKGKISIRLEKRLHANVLIFRDTGAGIPHAVLPHIFTRFYSWSPDNNNGLGAGIGLAFCRSVMESFGGTIRCESEPGEYAEFTLTFPQEAAI